MVFRSSLDVVVFSGSVLECIPALGNPVVVLLALLGLVGSGSLLFGASKPKINCALGAGLLMLVVTYVDLIMKS